ncbi:DUF6401 family natural product biosynthesis protein [Micromonospora endophytica]|uniref:Uncharacterized protein n=1 Tax=Micromonospora endophytica TaxID=515350 RepID=A0A2W2DGG0_9ACTN|nr:DUF6401 family natural product biosynthesis protein [Micromonospora endophytica]PZF99809.1 hypothetical protein C1I93_04580 [Micromonospora endophytica]RIW46486.1 hypothetical protein D3H59_12500 [Micromonospora endophytica]
MRLPPNQVPARTAVDSTRATLVALTNTVGLDGLAAATRLPGLRAAVDRHAAAVRDSLRGDQRPLSAAALAGYAEGLREVAKEHGWQPPVGPVDWSEADWVLVRLVAVCALTAGLGTPAPQPPPL